MKTRLSACALTLTAATLAIAAPVAAHIDPDPSQAQAGSTQTVGFTVEHGCDGSPTVQLDMRLPEGVTDPAPEPLDGWTAAVNNDIVTYTGGPLPADQELTIRITMTLPPTPDVTIHFPFVQRCAVGEIRWISTASSGADEPAPAMKLTGPVATTTSTSTAPTTVAPTTAAPAPATAAPTTAIPTTATAAPTTAAATPASPTTATPTTTAAADDNNNSTATIVFIAAVIAAILVLILAVLQARRSKARRERP